MTSNTNTHMPVAHYIRGSTAPSLACFFSLSHTAEQILGCMRTSERFRMELWFVLWLLFCFQFQLWRSICHHIPTILCTHCRRQLSLMYPSLLVLCLCFVCGIGSESLLLSVSCLVLVLVLVLLVLLVLAVLVLTLVLVLRRMNVCKVVTITWVTCSNCIVVSAMIC